MSSILIALLALPMLQEPAASASATIQDAASISQSDSSVAISHEEKVKRTYIFTTGSRYMLQRVLDELLADEQLRRKEANLPLADVEISDEEVETALAARIEAVRAQDPNLDFWQQVIAQGFTEKTFRQEMRRSIKARAMFFPLDPEQWPAEQLQEILGEQYWDGMMADSLKERLEAKAKNEPMGQINDQTLNMLLMPTIWRYLMDKAEILYPVDGLPEGVAMRVNGRDVKTDEVIAIINPFLGETDRKWAEIFVNRIEAAEAALTKSGKWLSDEAAAELLAAEAAEYEGTFIPHEMMVTQFLGYPSMEVYSQFFRAKHSFRQTLPEEGTEEYRKLQDAQIASRSTFYGAGKVDVDIILISARDLATGKFSLSGDPYQAAKEHANEVAEILATGTDFEEVLMEYSDLPERVPGSRDGMPQPHRGHLGMQSRNDLRGFVGESDYTDFLFGYSISDDIFFLAEEGGIYGPVRGPYGYYFYRVKSRLAPANKIDIDANERDLYIVNDDLLTTSFLKFLDGLPEAN
ncbi:MAG: hypothetical protein QM477_07650 [Planctomycetota bacterium]